MQNDRIFSTGNGGGCFYSFELNNAYWRHRATRPKLHVRLQLADVQHSANGVVMAQKGYTDMLGRNFKTEYADGTFSMNYYNAKSQVIRSVSPSSLTTLYEYDVLSDRRSEAGGWCNLPGGIHLERPGSAGDADDFQGRRHAADHDLELQQPRPNDRQDLRRRQQCDLHLQRRRAAADPHLGACYHIYL